MRVLVELETNNVVALRRVLKTLWRRYRVKCIAIRKACPDVGEPVDMIQDPPPSPKENAA